MPGYCSPDEMPAHRHHYYAWRQETLLVYPHVLCLPYSAPLNEISRWGHETGIEYLWHLSRLNSFDFQAGYDFFFKRTKDVAFFKLAWGGTPEGSMPIQWHLYYI